MIPCSNNYISNILAPSRQILARATVTMNALTASTPQVTTFAPTNYVGKTTGVFTVCANASRQPIANSTATSVYAPLNGNLYEIGTSDYATESTVNGVCRNHSTNILNAIAHQTFHFNVITLLEKSLGKNIWQGKTLLSDKIIIAKAIVSSMSCNWYGYGTNPTGNLASLNAWQSVSSAWDSPITHTNGTVTKLTLTLNDPTTRIDSTGFMYFLVKTSASNGSIASVISTDYVELVVSVSQTTTRTFDNTRIISAKVVEEVSILNLTVPANQLTLKMDNTDNLFSFLTLSNMYTIISSRPKIDLEYGLILPDTSVEWIPMGSFYLDNWQNDVGGMSVTFTAHDLMWVLGNTAYPPTAVTNCNALVVDIFSKAGITNYYIDPVVVTFVGNSRITWETNCRDLLQQVAILTGTTIHQDRYGQVRLEVIPSIKNSVPYTLRTSGTQIGLYYYASPTTYEVESTDGGMRNIFMDSMYVVPVIALDQSIYQVNINVYTTNPSDSSYTTYTFNNASIQGNSGQSFSLDIPLITSQAMAQTIANRFFSETMYNAVYTCNWRQNPVICPLDVLIVDDSNTTSKQTRLYKQEYDYVGYLRGTTESRGGL